MIKDIVRDTAFLSTPAEPATADDAAVAQDLLDTMAALSDNCACLAANQIGSTKAIIAFEEDGRARVMYNPKVKAAMGPYTAAESCLSLDGESSVKRFMLIRVGYEELVDGKLVARQKKFTDWTAEVIQHAIDHCNGKLV
jgi:peptide deformylase